jgi:hypothetical protein
MAVVSKGIKLSYQKSGSGTTFTDLTNLQEIPDLGGDTEAIEITTLADAAHVYTEGLKNYGDSLAFKFLYDPTQFTTLNGLSGTTQWKVTLPAATGSTGATCTFSGTCSVKLDGVGVNSALTYTLSIKPSTEMVWA